MDARKAALTRTSWLPRDDVRLSDWIEQGRRFGLIGRSVGWWIGDWLRYGNLKFGQRYVRASRITGYDVQTLMNMVYVAGAYEPAQRRERLSFSHHAELAALPEEEREHWLDVAEENRLSVRCLREELRRARTPAVREAAAAAQVGAAASERRRPGNAVPAARVHALRCPRCGSAVAKRVPRVAAGGAA